MAYKEYKGFYSDFTNEEKKGSKAADKTKKLSSYKLKAIYAKEDLSGWAIVEPQNKKKSLILEQNSKLDGYILTKLFKDYIIFQKNNIEYKLEIIKNKNMKYEIQRVDSKKEKIIAKGNNIKLQRNYLNQYVNDVEKVWENIKISDFKKDGKLDGFKINKINRNSVFTKLGLKKGDIIKSINGNRLKSYADAFKVYNI
ncbi:hypothetical protein [Halarcobacter anaerophilus]|uniref:hypothetical protein n=1 Tax=Halarcobacter anaerophilus TaxID=877500 RepID=UPI0005CAC824|nr:hypothetical protein [Halarcobacter anaerophilus]